MLNAWHRMTMQHLKHLHMTYAKAAHLKFFYPSVRHEGGLCLAAFWPDIIGIPVQGRHFAYHFNGEFIDMYRDETSGEVFKIIL